MADNKSKTFLVDKMHLANIAVTSQIPKNQSNKPEDKVYISKKEPDKNEDPSTTSPSENINILFVRDSNTGELHYSADTVKKYADLRKEGNMPEGFSIHQEPVGKYIEKQFSTYQVDFEKAIQSRDNKNLGLVALYMTRAHESNDQVALGKMIELIKNDPNYAFAFRRGTLDLNKLKGLSLMSEADVKAGFDNVEELEARTGGKFDSTKWSARGIDKIADEDIEEILMKNAEEIQVAEELPEQEIQDAESEQDVDVASNTARENLTRAIAVMVASLSSIKNLPTSQRIQKRMAEMFDKSKLAIDNKVKAGIFRINNKREENRLQENNSLENLLERSSLNKTQPTTEENTTAQLDDRHELDRERIAEKRKLEEAKARKAAGRKLTPEQEELLAQDTEERIRIAENKMKENNSIDQYKVSSTVIANINRAGKETYARQQESKGERNSENTIEPQDSDGR